MAYMNKVKTRVKATINANNANLPFIVRDSVSIKFNGNTKWVQLQAYGQNARFIKNQKINSNYENLDTSESKRTTC